MSAETPPERSPTDPRENFNTGRGMPARDAKPDVERIGKPPTAHDASVESSLAMPHERDQSTDMTPDVPDPRIQQAAIDVNSGREDTSKANETNRAYQDQKKPG
jgi:hypothetical protein